MSGVMTNEALKKTLERRLIVYAHFNSVLMQRWIIVENLCASKHFSSALEVEISFA